jgi:hypothetical protein
MTYLGFDVPGKHRPAVWGEGGLAVFKASRQNGRADGSGRR